MPNSTSSPRPRLTGRIAADLSRAIWRYRKETVLSLSLMIAAKLSIVLIPLVLKHIVDDLGRPVGQVLFPVFLVLAYALLRFLGDALNEARDVVFSIVTQRTVAAFTERTFAHLHRMSARFHARRETGAIVRDVQKGADGIGFLLGVALFTIVPTAFEIATIVAIMVRGYAREFTLAIAATFVCYAVYSFFFTRRRVAFQRAVNALEAQSDGRLVDSLLNYDTVKYFATEETETRRLSEVLEKWVHARTANQRALTALHVGQSAVIAFGIAAIMLLAAQRVVTGTMSVGDLILVNAYLIQICMPLNTLGFVFRETNDAMVKVERMFAILATQGRVGEDIDEPAAKPLIVRAGKIDFERVDFGYDPARPILRGVDFHAYAGKTLAVVGGSGSGKSTIVKLLFRLYQPERGVIRIDGQDIGKVTQRSLREAIGIVPQDTVLFNETIAYNIAYGRPSATREDVVRGARRATGRVHRAVAGPLRHARRRTRRTSVGRRASAHRHCACDSQRSAHHRVDEATSALDTRSERAIQTELIRLAQGRTSIVIAHRLSTVVDADWILVMEHGRVVEQGTHRELLSRDAVYAKMWSLQWQQGELEHAQRKLTAQSVSVAILTSGAIDALHGAIAARRVSVQLDLVDNDLRVTGDPSILAPVIVELCRNEIVHARPGERIALRVERHNNHVWLSVLGMGDKPAELSASAAQRMEATLASAGGGFTLMPLHGHLAYVAMLPLHPVADAHPQKRPAAPEDDAAPLRDLLVMAIDDQEEARDALEAVLCASGARVQLASSGVQALEWLRRTQTGGWPQLLLCDIVLANEDGYDVLRRIRQLENERAISASLSMPAIALTGYAEREDRARAQQAGFQAHLTKPVPPEKLIVEIRKLAGERTRA